MGKRKKKRKRAVAVRKVVRNLDVGRAQDLVVAVHGHESVPDHVLVSVLDLVLARNLNHAIDGRNLAPALVIAVKDRGAAIDAAEHALAPGLGRVLVDHAIVVTAPKIEQKTKTSQRINLVTRIREGTRTGRRKKGKKRKRKGRSVLKALTKTPPTKRNTNAAGNPSLDHRLKAKVVADLGRQVVVDRAKGRLFFSISLTQNILIIFLLVP